MKTNKIFFGISRDRVIASTLGMGLALLLLILFLSAWSGDRYQRSSQWRDHSDKVIAQMRQLRISLEMAESSQRGYLITGQDSFLGPYRSAHEAVETQLKNLLDLVSDNPSQTARLNRIEPLIQEKMTRLSDMTEMIRGGQRQLAIDLVKQGRGRELMDQIRAEFSQLESDEVFLLKQRTTRADGDYRKASLTVLTGLLLAFLFLFTATRFLRKEIRRRRQIQLELEDANMKAHEASNMKSSFLANMSHEIRTPLNGIIGMSRLLEQTTLDPKQKDFVETIKISSNSLLALINEILDLSKIESGKLQLEDAHFELGSLLKSTISIVEFAAQTKGLQLSLDVGADVPDYFMGDPLRLRQVLLNLLNNSIKFSEQGMISLKVQKIAEEESKIRLMFEIADQGIGLDAETKEKLFRVFTQGDDSTSRKYGGTGLGLAISKQIVEMMGGRIDVESVKGIGSRFFFELTLKPAKYEEMSQPVTLDSLTTKKLSGRILIAEDNRTNQKVVAEMMTLLGCEIVIVDHGALAIEALKKDERFDLILMDGQMPIMDGYEATRRIREGEGGSAHRKIPIIATTANAIKGDVEKCFEAGMNDYIGKPISYDDLTIKVEKWLRRGKQTLDDSSLSHLIKLSEKSKKNLLKELVQVFDEDTTIALEDMRQAIAQQKFEEVSRIAHTLKSSSANLGVLRMRDLSLWLERSAKDSTQKQLLMLVDALRKEFEEAIPELRQKAAELEAKTRS